MSSKNIDNQDIDCSLSLSTDEKLAYYISCHRHRVGCTCFYNKNHIHHKCGRTNCQKKPKKWSNKGVKNGGAHCRRESCPICPC